MDEDLTTKAEQTAQEERGMDGPAAAPDPIKHWIEGYEPRMQKHIQFALKYADDFDHGAPGHLDLITIAKLARHLSFSLDVEPPRA